MGKEKFDPCAETQQRFQHDSVIPEFHHGLAGFKNSFVIRSTVFNLA
jgi:hypothetical protein